MIRILRKHVPCSKEFLGKSKMKRRKVLIGASILSTDFMDIKNTIKKINESDLDFIHFDIMDGVFVPNISYGPHFVECVRKHSSKIFDVHLMIKNPLPYIKNFVDAGADIITIHCESDNVLKSLKLIKKLNVKSGIVLNPKTSFKKIKKYLPFVDVVMVMTVEPGFGGQKFMDNQITKIEKISSLISEQNKKILLEVDGGINFDTAKKVIDVGANVLVVGSFLFFQKNIKDTIKTLHIL